MGLFSTKTIITVATTTSRVLEDSVLPNSLKSGTIRSLFTEDSLVESIMDDALNSIGIKAERMYQFGKRDYLYGVPTSSSHLSKSASEVVKDIIEQSEGRVVTLEYYHYGPLNNLHYGWQTLVTTYGYSQATNELAELSAVKGAPVYLQDMQVVVREATVAELSNGALAQWGAAATAGYTPLRPAQSGNVPRSQTPFGVDASSEEDYFRLTYIWQDTATKVVNTEMITFGIPLDTGVEYFQAKYSYLIGTVKQSRYFTYQAGSGSYLALDMIFSPEYDDVGSFFPYGYFRYNKQSAAGNPGSPEYATSAKLMKYLGIDYAQVADAIEQNPQIGDVESALLMMAVPADTTDPLEQKYLFDFFKALYIQSASAGTPMSVIGSTVANALYDGGASNGIAMVVQDARFKSALSMQGIYRQIRFGSIGTVGTNTSGRTVITVNEHGTTYANKTAPPGAEFIWTTQVPSNFYRRQITETLYEEYLVLNLKMTYYVWQGYHASPAQTLVPIDRSITKDYAALDREHLYARSLHYVFNSKHETKLKWYQQEWFRTVLIIVALVLTVYSWGSASGALAAAIAAGAVATLEYILIYFILVPMLMRAVMKMFVKWLGPEAALVLSMVLAVWAGYSAIDAGSVQGAPWASELLQVSSGLIQQVQTHYTEALKGISDQAMEFGAFAQQKQEELTTANKLLEHDSLLSPFVIFGESPDEYFNRTVHSGNIGVVGIDAISSYVDIALELPRMNDTLTSSGLVWG